METRSQTRSFKLWQWVWVYHLPSDKQKLGRGWNGSYLVRDKLGELNYRVQAVAVVLLADHLDAPRHMKLQAEIGMTLCI